MKPPVLIIGYGNPSRGDDALAPLLLDRLRDCTDAELDGVELLTDFQLQVEHVLDLEGREDIVFVDAALRGGEPFDCGVVVATGNPVPSTHALSPESLLAVYQSHFGVAAPPSRLLAIRGYSFELGGELSGAARRNLDAAFAELRAWLAGRGAANQTAICGIFASREPVETPATG